MTSLSQTANTHTIAAPAAPSRRYAAWRDLVTGPGPLWWRVLRWSQRASRN